MGIVSTSNHLALINACYPKPPHPALDVLKPDSNSLSKLSFYCSGRPKKIPKVTDVLLARIESSMHSITNPLKRGEVGITLDIVKILVGDCRSDLQCFAETALKIAFLALGVNGTSDDEMVLRAKGATLFCAVASLVGGPLMGSDEGIVSQYHRCLERLEKMAQSGDQNSLQRTIALQTLKSACLSDMPYCSTSGFEEQIQTILPALLFNCISTPGPQLEEELLTVSLNNNVSRLGELSSRKLPVISTEPSSSITQTMQCMFVLFRLSHPTQLSAILTNVSRWLDTHDNGSFWSQSNGEFVHWIGQAALVGSSAQYRPMIISWWSDLAASLHKQNERKDKVGGVLSALAGVLGGPVVSKGISTGTVLAQLLNIIVQESMEDSLGNPPNDKEIITKVQEIISALVKRVYYYDQIADMTSDVIDTIQGLQPGGEESAGVDEAARWRATYELTRVLDLIIRESNGSEFSGSGSAGVTITTSGPDDETLKANGTNVSIESKASHQRIPPQVFQHSLFLLSYPDLSTRRMYHHTLEHYLETELQVSRNEGDPIDSSRAQMRFYEAFHNIVFGFATSFIGSSTSSGGEFDSSLLLLSRNVSRRTRRMSNVSPYPASSRQSSITAAPPHLTVEEEDYIMLKRLVSTEQKKPYGNAVPSGVSMFLKLERSVWKPQPPSPTMNGDTDSTSEYMTKIHHCRQISEAGLGGASTTWGVDVVLHPTSASLGWEEIVADAFSNCGSLQRALGWDHQTIKSALLGPEYGAKDGLGLKGSLPAGMYRQQTRSVSNISTTKLRSPDRPSGFQTPTLADMQSSLGGTGGAQEGSGGNSIASGKSGLASGYETSKRRTVRASPSDLLAGLGIKRRPRSGSRLSLVER